MEEKSFITVGVGTPEERKIEMKRFMQFQFTGNRLVTITEQVDGSFCILVENPESSGRTNQKVWLSRESFLAVVCSLNLFLGDMETDLSKELLALANNQDLQVYRG